MAEYSAAEQFNNSSTQRMPLVEFTLASDLAVNDRQSQGNVIHLNTSEKLRLIEQVQPCITGSLNNVDLKKTSSFQITSVTVSSSISNDGEDDSCGEVDDSQLDPGDIEDIRNPLDSECFDDTGADSGLSVTSNSNMPVALGHQQVQDSSFGLRNEEKDQAPQNHVTAAAETSGLKQEDKDQVLRRFRVVKIESSEPYVRGRWACRDFYDQPSVQPSLSKEEPGSVTTSTGSLSEQPPVDDFHAVHSNTIPSQSANPSHQVLPVMLLLPEQSLICISLYRVLPV